jgi:aspartate racemase
MKTLGLIGGMSWVSTIDYYRYINEGINAKLGGLNFAQCLLYSFSYSEIVNNGSSGNLEATYQRMEEVAKMLQEDGAAGLVLCANTAHMNADRLQQQLNIPIIHIGVAIADAIVAMRLNKVALLGTKFTMEKDFIKDKLRDKGIETIVPKEEDRIFIHHTIHDELGKGEIKPETKARYIQISNRLIAEGAQGVILGCTEIPLIIQPGDLAVPTFDTAKIHSDAAVEFMLNA